MGSPGMGGSATGAFKINGKIEGKSFVLAFQTAKGAFSVSLTRGGGASPSSTSPDGLWRGTYTCGEGGGQWSGPGGPFTIDLTLKLDGSTSSGGGSNPSIANGRTTNVEVSVSQKTVTVGRSWMGMNQHSQKSFLNGQLDGNTIRASGKENLSKSRLHAGTDASAVTHCHLRRNRSCLVGIAALPTLTKRDMAKHHGLAPMRGSSRPAVTAAQASRAIWRTPPSPSAAAVGPLADSSVQPWLPRPGR